MSRLPKPGSDAGTWGGILNDFLGVSHDADGSLKPAAVTAAGAVSTSDSRLTDQRTPLDDSVTSAKIVDGTIVDADINASAAIANSKLATNPLARSNHTGTQTASTISDFNAAAVSAGSGTYPTITSVAKNYRPSVGVMGLRAIAIGHSIVSGTSPTSGTNSSYSQGAWFTHACALSGGRLIHLRNAGIAGQTLDQIAARVSTDVTPYNPDIVFIEALTNSSGDG